MEFHKRAGNEIPVISTGNGEVRESGRGHGRRCLAGRRMAALDIQSRCRGWPLSAHPSHSRSLRRRSANWTDTGRSG